MSLTLSLLKVDVADMVVVGEGGLQNLHNYCSKPHYPVIV